MLPFHERLAAVGLTALADFGFVLAGGYAIAQNGIGDRPSDDVDLFTNVDDPERFGAAAATLRKALRADGLDVEDVRVRPTFVDLHVSDPTFGTSSELPLGLDFRNYPPAQLTIGHVLDVRDAVAGKLTALWSRGEARDFIDIDAVVESGRFTLADLMAIADQVEAQPMDRRMLAARFRGAGQHPEPIYSRYGVDPNARARIIARFAQWAGQIDPTAAATTYERVDPPVRQPHRDVPLPRDSSPGLRP